MTWDEDRKDYGIFKIENAFSKFFCITRLMTWLCAFVFFYCHVIIMWGRWSDPDGVWLWTATYSGIAALFCYSLSGITANFDDPYLFNKWFAKFLYGALAGFSLYHFHLDHNYSFGAWLVPLASLILTGATGVTIVQELHRISMAYNKRGHCKRFKEQLINNGEVTQYCCATPKCKISEDKSGGMAGICCFLIYLGIAIFVLWGYAHLFDYYTCVKELTFVDVFIIEWILGTAWYCAILWKNIFKSALVMFVFVAVLNTISFGVGALIPNIYMATLISLLIMAHSIILRFKAEEGKIVVFLGKAEGIFVFSGLPIFHLLYHYNIASQGSVIYDTLMTMLFIVIGVIFGCFYFQRKKIFSNIQ
jgi:hypothetical protein